MSAAEIFIGIGLAILLVTGGIYLGALVKYHTHGSTEPVGPIQILPRKRRK